MKHSQQVKNNSLFSNSLSIFLIRFFPSLASTLVVIWFSRNLNKEIYGAYQNFWIQLNVIYPLACFGIHTLIITYKSSFIIKLKNSFSFHTYLLYGLWVLLLASVFAVLQHQFLHLSFAVSSLFLFSFALSFIFESVLIVFKSFWTLIVVNLLYSGAFLFFHWWLLQDGLRLDILFLYLLLICLGRFAIYAVATFLKIKKNEATEVADEKEVDINKVRSLWLHLGSYDVIQVLFNWIDKFIISILLAGSVSAIYFNGTQNIPFLPILLSAAGSAVLLQLSHSNKEEDTEHAVSLMNQSGKLLSCVMFPVFFFLLVFRYEVFDVLFSGRYFESVPIFLVSILVIPVRAYSFTTILQNRHKGKIINIVALADLVLACILMYPLYQLMGLPGLALSFIVTTYLQAGVYLFYTARLLNVKLLSLIPCINWGAKLIVFASLFIVFHYAVHAYFTGLIALILGVILCIVCISVALWIELKIAKAHEKA